jgi:hypothetical protein
MWAILLAIITEVVVCLTPLELIHAVTLSAALPLI